MLLGNMETGSGDKGEGRDAAYEHVEAETTQRDATQRTRRESGIKLRNRGHPAQKPAGCQRKPCSGGLNGFPHCARRANGGEFIIGLISTFPLLVAFQISSTSTRCIVCSALGEFTAAIVLWHWVVISNKRFQEPLIGTSDGVVLLCVCTLPKRGADV